MPEIYINRYTTNQMMLVEDPNPNFNRIWIGTRAHDINSLLPIWNKDWHFTHINRFYSWNSGSMAFNSTRGLMALERGSTNCWGDNDSQAESFTGGEAYHTSLDPIIYPPKRLWRTASGKTIYWSILNDWNNSGTNSDLQGSYIGIVPYDDLADVTRGGCMNGPTGTNGPTFMFYEDPVNNRIYGLRNNYNARSEAYVISAGLDNMQQYNQTSISGYNSTNVNNKKTFFIGPDNEGFVWYVWVDDAVGNQYRVFRVNPLDLSGSLPPASIHATGPLASTTAIYRGLDWNFYRGYPSNILRNGANRRVFYSTHFASDLTLAPIRFVFDAANGNVTWSNCNVAYAGSNTFNTYSSFYSTSSSGPAGVDTTWNRNSFHMKGHVFTTPQGNNYITFWLVDKSPASGSGSTRWSTPARRTMMTYQIGSGTGTGGTWANDDSLTFHSSYTFASTGKIPRSYLPLNAAGTSVAVPVVGGVDFFSFNQSLGWQATGNYPLEMRSIGLDSTNRLYGIAQDKASGSLHTMLPTVPVTITVTMAANNYSYTGANVNTSTFVSAYDSNGSRIATTINLAIDGTTMVFQSNNTKSVQVTTSTSAETSVPVVITGGGINNIIANVNI